MKNHKKFSFPGRIQSFVYAFRGLKIFAKEEHNFRIHLLATILVIVSGLFAQLSCFEWLALIFAIAFVIITEILNTAVENLADFVSPGQNEKIGKVKDIAAAAVLVAAIVAVTTGGFIFLPRFSLLFS
ncbi:diacylglycerol kinase family protein [Maribellus maritimus]|uniref:diacylglycerol kinase family protein n=1 Tax=Maribellus maritimus TaxID=2870838 RepID=UPI001EE9EF53|nr:diacylglycerol kinase family protein [Maribellus maritimus]MCG6187723.1 diacylglycerol kinase family protein [Maribellus maritimus]